MHPFLVNNVVNNHNHSFGKIEFKDKVYQVIDQKPLDHI